MKLKDALFEMKIGDRFNFLSGGNFITKTAEQEFHWRVDGACFMLGDYLDYCDNEGEIIRAEPEVLTASEIAENIWNGDKNNAYLHSTTYGTACAKEADKNGQIKEWKRPKQVELRDAIEEYKKHCEAGTVDLDRVFKAYKNLTPPWEPEK